MATTADPHGNDPHDDYSLARVPPHAKQVPWRVTIVRLGALAAVSQLMLGAQLGYGMTFNGALVAVLLGSVLLQFVGFGVGMIAAREGLSLSMLSRWTGFGTLGSALIGLVMAISLTGWFGVQNSVFAQGMHAATHLLNPQIWSVITGLSVVAIVVFGFRMLSTTANIAFPLFLAAVGYAFVTVMNKYDIGALFTTPAPGTPLSLATATTMVAGGFIIGAVMTPDISRFLSRGKDVFWMVLISTFVGELGMCLIAVLMAHAVKSPDIVTLMLQLSGWLGAAIVIFSTIKTNDINLYSSSLGVTTALNALFKRRFNRAAITIGVGLLGTVMSALGIMNHFIDFLVLLGVAIPPIAAIMVVDYYLLRRDRQLLDASRATGELPASAETWNPVALVAWAIAFAVGYVIKSGIPALNSLLAAGLSYWLLMTLTGAFSGKGTLRFGHSHTPAAGLSPVSNLDD